MARSRNRLALLIGALALAGLASGCNDNSSGDTIIVNGLDCGLVRGDLAGDWSVTYFSNTATLQNCDDPMLNGVVVDVTGAVTTIYNGVISFPGAAGATFSAVGAGPDLPNELQAGVQADSCLALVQLWENDDAGWVQCVGGLDLTANAIAAVCDAIDLDTDADGVADTACDLSRSFTATITTP